MNCALFIGVGLVFFSAAIIAVNVILKRRTQKRAACKAEAQ